MIRKSLIALIAAMLPLVSCVKEEQKTEILLNLEQVSLTEGETLQLTCCNYGRSHYCDIVNTIFLTCIVCNVV